MKTVKLNKEKVNELFATAKSSNEAITELYKMVFPNWDDIEHVDDWPKCSAETSQWICEKFMALNRRIGENFMPGGIWMNNGFSTFDNEGLEFLEVRPMRITLKEKASDEKATAKTE